MPELPNGQRLYLGLDHILEPGSAWFKCPEGCFWYQREDRVINEPPFKPHQDIALEFLYAPVPKTHEAAMRFVKVFFEDQTYKSDKGVAVWWRGDWLGTFEPLPDWTDTDIVYWQDWLSSADVAEFMDGVIDKCQRQAEWMQTNADLPDFKPQPATPLDESRLTRLKIEWKRLKQLQSEERHARDHNDQPRMGAVFSQLIKMEERLLVEVEIPGYLQGFAHMILGVNLKQRQLLEQAVEHFKKALLLNPFHRETLMQLGEVQVMQDEFDKALITCQRVVNVYQRDATAWGNLALIFIKLKMKPEAREALDNALAINPKHERHLLMDQHFDDSFDSTD